MIKYLYLWFSFTLEINLNVYPVQLRHSTKKHMVVRFLYIILYAFRIAQLHLTGKSINKLFINILSTNIVKIIFCCH